MRCTRLHLSLAAAVLGLALSTEAPAVEGPNPFQGQLPAEPPYAPDQRIMISDPPDGAALVRSPDRITINFRRSEFEDLRPSSLELWIDGVEYTEQLEFWTDVAWVDLPADLLGPGEHLITASIQGGVAGGLSAFPLYATSVLISIYLGPCPGGCPWPFSPTGEPHVVSNLMENWQDFGYPPYFHSGIDIRADAHAEVRACAAGTVVKKVNYSTPPDDDYWEVAIQDATGLIWQYHHLDEASIAVNLNDPVARGQVIGQIVEWNEFMNGERYNHLHLNTVRWQGGGPIPGPYVDGWRYYNPLQYLTPGTYVDAIAPDEWDVWFGFNENPVPYGAESDATDPVLSTQVDVVARLSDEMTYIGPPDLGQPYDLGLYDLSWSAHPLDTPCGMGWVPRTRLARFDLVPGGTTTAGNAAALEKIYREFLFYDGTHGAIYGYGTKRFTYTLTNTKNGFPDDVNGYWDTSKSVSLGGVYPDGHYVVKVYARDFTGNETVTTVPVTLNNGKTWSGTCPPYIASLKVLQGPYLMSAFGPSAPAQPIDVPLTFGPVIDGTASAIVEGVGWPAWYIDLPGTRVAVGLLSGREARVEYVPLLGDVIVTLDAEVQVLPPGGLFNPVQPSIQPVSLRLSTRLARDPAGPALIGTPGETSFDVVMAKAISVGGEPMTLRLEPGAVPNAEWEVNPLDIFPPFPSSSVAVAIVAPNPFVAGGTLALAVGAAHHFEVDVMDARGRRVRELFRGPLASGTNRLHWDACDATGAALPAGVYFVRARGAGSEARQKIVLMR